MSNFDFLKDFNNELYEIGNRLEKDVLMSPRAVTADATIFLETLVKDIYRLSETKMKPNVVSFYKKIDFLYRSGVITYIYKNKLQDAYNLRNEIHRDYQNAEEEYKIALDLHKRLYYISKKYYRDYAGDDRYLNIPDYRTPTKNEIHFENCIICGKRNTRADSNMCSDCNLKIENANNFMSLKNMFGENSSFTKDDLMGSSFSESESISMILELTRENLITKIEDEYYFNNSQFEKFMCEINRYIEIGSLISRLFNGEISGLKIKDSEAYESGKNNELPYVEFYRIVRQYFIGEFEEKIIETGSIERSMKITGIDYDDLDGWFKTERDAFISGSINEGFIRFNQLLIKEYFNLKKRGIDDLEIYQSIHLSDEIFDFWVDYFEGDNFTRKLRNLKKNMILNEIKKDKSLEETLKSVNVSEKEFRDIFEESRNSENEFYEKFKKDYVEKRQKLFLKHLRTNNIGIAIKKAKISEGEFEEWYFRGELEFSQFYINTTRMLMDKYLKARMNGENKRDILEKLSIPKAIFKSWSRHDDVDLFISFKRRNLEITSSLLKRGLIINAIKEDKSKSEALEFAGISEEEFAEIYRNSKREKTNFHKRFDSEYRKSRQRQFVGYLKGSDYYNAIHKSGITQKEFQKWYVKEKKNFYNREGSEFYTQTTRLLMAKYLDARREGKNKPDAARSVGLTNSEIDYWLRNGDVYLYNDFIQKHDQMILDLITDEFRNSKAKYEVSQICDVPISQINACIEKGKNGEGRYKEIYELYNYCVIPKQLDAFLSEIRTKSLKKSLKAVNLTENELNHYYELGKSRESQFNEFHKNYLKFKIGKYVEVILSKKTHRIALKNSNLSSEEFEENEAQITDSIIKGRIEIMGNALLKSKTTTSRLSKLSGLSVEEIYDWYFKGKNGDERFEIFALMFELIQIIPKSLAFGHAHQMGVPKNYLFKKLKKDLDPTEFRIWQENSIVNNDGAQYIQIDCDDAKKRKLLNLIENSDFLKSCRLRDSPEYLDFMKKAAKHESQHLQIQAEKHK